MTIGKVKGGAFERDISKALSLWITNGKRADTLWRSAMSGGRATIAFNKGERVRQAGDITAVHPDGAPFVAQWYIECKFYKNLEIQSSIISGRGKLFTFWNKTVIEARKHNRSPMLIAKQNLVPILVLTREPVCPHHIRVNLPNSRFSICKFDDMIHQPDHGGSKYGFSNRSDLRMGRDRVRSDRS
jgi:hypothetical protein